MKNASLPLRGNNDQPINPKSKERVFYEGVVTAARFFIETVLPEAVGRMQAVQKMSDAALVLWQILIIRL